MKKHAIIPIFIPHRGCPNDCVFCNQREITAQIEDVTSPDVRKKIEEYLVTLEGRGLETIEVAFFGGSFTGIPIEEQSAFLKVAKEYKDIGKIDKIHLSTRPDYIDERILNNLKKYGTDIIELGIQSFDDEVLAASQRGHDSRQAVQACKLVKEWGFELGIQLMIGLPSDTKEKAILSSKKAVKLAPSSARLYPTVIIRNTKLMEMYKEGSYVPLDEDEAVEITAEMYKLLHEAGIKILRVGLKSTDIMTDKEGGAALRGTYHPAFRQLVEGRIAREALEGKLNELQGDISNVTFASNSACFSNMIGHKGENKRYFAENYASLNISYIINQTLADNEYIVIKF
ncbi:MAG: radical SAM protein [Eubacteriales bacterium]|nr:radical SAM protein [Eubacteriales bacterium]MDD4390606.1 radical SAM protein [Eubacteriales bacterium]